MQHKFFQLLFSISLLGCCWLGMMALHELGHVLGAVIVSARIEKVVLHPLTIWHRMGSIENFLRRPQPISASDSLIAAGLFAVMFFAGAFFYPV